MFSSLRADVEPAQLQTAAQAVACPVQDDVAVVPPDAEAAADFFYFHAHDFSQVEDAGGVFRQAAEAVFQRAEKILLFGIVFRRPPGGGPATCPAPGRRAAAACAASWR